MNHTDLILVTGGTGFVGKHLIALLADKGYKIRAIYRGSSKKGKPDSTHPSIEWVEADINDIVSLENAFQGVTHVFHCAALVSFFPREVAAMMHSNVEGTANIVNMSLEFGIKKLIHVSSIAALGRSKERPILDETCKWIDGSGNSKYAISKYRAEQEVRRGQAEGLDVAIVNPSVIVGIQDWDEGMAKFFKQIDKGLKLTPSGSSGFVDVRDVVRFMVLLFESNVSGERYILNAVNIPHQEFFGMIAKNLGVKPPSIVIGPDLMEFAWRVEWLRATLLRSDPKVTKESGRASVSNYTYINEKSVKAFDFQYIPFEQSIREIAEAYRKTS